MYIHVHIYRYTHTHIPRQGLCCDSCRRVRVESSSGSVASADRCDKSASSLPSCLHASSSSPVY